MHAATKKNEEAQLKLTRGGGDGKRAREGSGGRGKVRLVEQSRQGRREKVQSRGQSHKTIGEGGLGAGGRVKRWWRQ